MKHPAKGPEIVVCAERQRVDRMMARLRGVIECRCLERAERRFSKIQAAIDASVPDCEALYAAAQSLRDLDVIDDEEAAFIAVDCYDARREEFVNHDRVYRRILKAAARAEFDTGRLDQLAARERELSAIFHEARGETRWAAMVRAADSSFSAYVAEGEVRLFGSELVPCELLDSIDAPAARRSRSGRRNRCVPSARSTSYACSYRAHTGSAVRQPRMSGVSAALMANSSRPKSR